MKLSLADRRAMIKAMMGEEGPFDWKASNGTAAAVKVDAQLVTERYDAQGNGGNIVSTITRRLHVVEEDVAVAVGDHFIRSNTTWKVGAVIDEGTGVLELDLKKV
jgi:hypothetical protein